jgi:hypothetical protein
MKNQPEHMSIECHPVNYIINIETMLILRTFYKVECSQPIHTWHSFDIHT